MSAGTSAVGANPSTATYTPVAATAVANQVGAAVADSVSRQIPVPEVVSLIGSYVDFVGGEVTDAGAYASELFRTLGFPSAIFNSFDVQLSTRTTLPSQREVELYRTHATLFRDPRDASKLSHPWLVNVQIVERVFQAMTAMNVDPLPTPEMLVDYLTTFVGLQCMYIEESNKLIVEFSLQQPAGVEVERFSVMDVLTVCLRHYRHLTLCVLMSRPASQKVTEYSLLDRYRFSRHPEPDLPTSGERGYPDIQKFTKKYPHIANPPQETLVNEQRTRDASWVAFELWPQDICLELRNTYYRVLNLNSQPFVEAILKSRIKLPQEDLDCALMCACTQPTISPSSFDLAYITKLVELGANLNYTAQSEPLLFHVFNALENQVWSGHRSFQDAKRWMAAAAKLQQATGTKTPRPYNPDEPQEDEYVVLPPEFFGIEGAKLKNEPKTAVMHRKAEYDFAVKVGLAINIVPFDQLLKLRADPNVVSRKKEGLDLIEAIAHHQNKGKRAAIARALIGSIMRSAKEYPPSSKLALSMYIHFRELLTPNYLKSLEGNLKKAVQSSDFQKTLDSILILGLGSEMIALNNAVDLVHQYGANSTEQIDLFLFKAYCAGSSQRRIVHFLKEQGFRLIKLTNRMLDLYLVDLSKNPHIKLIDRLAVLKEGGFPFTSEQFLKKLLARSISDEARFGSLMILLGEALKAIRNPVAAGAAAPVSAK
jgi:hypothetical protein